MRLPLVIKFQRIWPDLYFFQHVS